MRCESCHEARPTADVTLMYNVGFILFRFSGSSRGWLCRRCISSTFWSYTAINLVAGWWGIVSFFVNFVAIPTNVAAYIQGLALSNDPITVGGRPVAAQQVSGPAAGCPSCGPGTRVTYALGRSRCSDCRAVF